MAETMHHSDYDGPWPWPDFTPGEIACRHCGELFADDDSLKPTARQPFATQEQLRMATASTASIVASGSEHGENKARGGGSAAEAWLRRSERSMDCLQRLRDGWGKPVRLTSAHRCAEHNRRVGGAPHSQHLKLAFDCACPAAEQDAFVSLARRCGFTGVGRYPGRNFVHLDCGPERSWRG